MGSLCTDNTAAAKTGNDATAQTTFGSGQRINWRAVCGGRQLVEWRKLRRVDAMVGEYIKLVGFGLLCGYWLVRN